jgi:hypothetical protein
VSALLRERVAVSNAVARSCCRWAASAIVELRIPVAVDDATSPSRAPVFDSDADDGEDE